MFKKYIHSRNIHFRNYFLVQCELTYLPNPNKRMYTDWLAIILDNHTIFLHLHHHTIVIKQDLLVLYFFQRKIPIIKVPKN